MNEATPQWAASFIAVSVESVKKAISRPLLRIAVWTGDTRDTRPEAVLAYGCPIALQQTIERLLDYFVGKGEQRRRHVEAQRLRGL
jgi:hypothetical protein